MDLMSYWVSLSEVALDCRFCLIYGLLYLFQIYLDLDFAFSEKQRQCCLKKEAIVPNFNDTEQHESKDEEHSMLSVNSLIWHGGSLLETSGSTALLIKYKT